MSITEDSVIQLNDEPIEPPPQIPKTEIPEYMICTLQDPSLLLYKSIQIQQNPEYVREHVFHNISMKKTMPYPNQDSSSRRNPGSFI